MFISNVIDISAAHIDHLGAVEGQIRYTPAVSGGTYLINRLNIQRGVQMNAACRCNFVETRMVRHDKTLTFFKCREQNAISLLICVNSMILIYPLGSDFGAAALFMTVYYLPRSQIIF